MRPTRALQSIHACPDHEKAGGRQIATASASTAAGGDSTEILPGPPKTVHDDVTPRVAHPGVKTSTGQRAGAHPGPRGPHTTPLPTIASRRCLLPEAGWGRCQGMTESVWIDDGLGVGRVTRSQ